MTNVVMMTRMMKKAFCLERLTLSLIPTTSPGPGRIRTKRMEILQKVTVAEAERSNRKFQDDISKLVIAYTNDRKTEQPNTNNADVFDSDSTRLPQPLVGNRVNYSQVALNASKHVKNCLSKIESGRKRL